MFYYFDECSQRQGYVGGRVVCFKHCYTQSGKSLKSSLWETPSPVNLASLQEMCLCERPTEEALSFLCYLVFPLKLLKSHVSTEKMIFPLKTHPQKLAHLSWFMMSPVERNPAPTAAGWVHTQPAPSTTAYQRLTNLHRSVIHRAQETHTFHCLHHQLSPQRLFRGHGPPLPDPNLLLTFLGFRRAICASLGSQLTCHTQSRWSCSLSDLIRFPQCRPVSYHFGTLSTITITLLGVLVLCWFG